MNLHELSDKASHLRQLAATLRGNSVGSLKASDALLLEELATSLDQCAAELKRQTASLDAVNLTGDRFITNLSHELRTPLAPVLLLVSAMQSDPSLPQEVRDDLETVRDQIELEARLVEDLLDANRLNQGRLKLRLEPADVHAILVAAVAAAQVAMPSIPNIKMDFRATRHSMNADAARLRQAFIKLVNNSVKFTPAGGFVEIRTRDADERIAVEIVDTGKGFDPAVLPRLFEVFEQEEAILSRSTGGLGLGLPIARGLFALHGGTLTGQSDGAGKGSIFRVMLPVDAALSPASVKPAAPGKVAAPIQQSIRNDQRILLVEDHADSLAATARLLVSMGFDVATAEDFGSAKSKLERERFDLLLCDIELPDGNGWDLMKPARQSGTLKGIALSGYGTEEDQQKSRQAGFSQHLVKPITAQKLRESIHELFANGK